MSNLLDHVISQFVDEKVIKIQPIGNGLIHKTWKVELLSQSIVLQQLNNSIFKNPIDICNNIIAISRHLGLKKDYPYEILNLILTKDQKPIYYIDNQFFRATKYLENTLTIDVLDSPDIAFKVANAYGTFTKFLADFDSNSLRITIPDFHNGSKRYDELMTSIKLNKFKRVKYCSDLINKIINFHPITQKIDALKKDHLLPIRIVHYDTKINNILLDKQNYSPKMIIDLDTTMPGTVLSDFGDMVRTATATKDENETNIDLVNFDLNYFENIVNGYLSAMGQEINVYEKSNLLNGGKYLILMQCERFLTDFLNGDQYYSSQYDNQNLDRALNQMKLLESIMDQESDAMKILNHYLK